MRRTRRIRVALVSGAFALGGMMLIPGMAAAQHEATPTYAQDVAPIFRAKCENCHRPGYIAPMSLQTYTESRPWARSIKNRVETRQMPPWHIDKSVGIQAFQNDRSLTNGEIDTIVRWVDGGAPRGNPADLPPPRCSPTMTSGTSRIASPGRRTWSSTRRRTPCRPSRRTPGGSRRCPPD